MVQAFRRGKNEEPTRTFRLRGLDRAARYTIENLDGQGPTTVTGRELMEDGLAVVLPERPAAAVVLYSKAGD